MCRCHFLITFSSAGAEERDRFLPPGSSSTDGPESVGYFLCVNVLKIVQVTLSIKQKQKPTPEASQTVLDLAISVYGSSCNYIFFGLIFSYFRLPPISWHPILPWGYN